MKELDQSANGKTILLNSHQALDIHLESNATTGYRWELEEIDREIIDQIGEASYVAAAHPAGMVGVGGVETWSFVSLNQGDSRLRFVYRRPWETDQPPVKAFEVMIQVRAYCEG